MGEVKRLLDNPNLVGRVTETVPDALFDQSGSDNDAQIEGAGRLDERKSRSSFQEEICDHDIHKLVRENAPCLNNGTYRKTVNTKRGYVLTNDTE